MSKYKETKLSTPSPNEIQHLIKELLRVWSTKSIDEKYQNYFLTYLDTLPSPHLQTQIADEIKATLENKSHFFRIGKAMDNHDECVNRLKSQLALLDRSQDITEDDLELVCNQLGDLRTSNLHTAEAILALTYHCLAFSPADPALIQGNNYLLEKLDNDSQFLKKSLLQRYIVFSNSYDPFFLHHYETVRKVHDFKYKKIPCIQELFNLSISLAYKLMKHQQEILELFCGRVATEVNRVNTGKVKRYSYRLIDQIDKADLQANEESSKLLRLDNDAYLQLDSPHRFKEEKQFVLPRSQTDSPQKLSRYFKEDRFNMHPKTYSRYHTEHSNKPNNRYNLLPKLENKGVGDSRISNNSYVVRANSTKGGSEKANVHKYMFKIRRPRHQSNDYNDLQPSFGDSIKLIRQRDEQFMKSLPFKQRQKHYIIEDEEYTRGKDVEVREMEIQTADGRDSNREDPLIHPNYHSPTPVRVQQDSELQKRTNPMIVRTLKNFKLKAGNLSTKNIFVFLKELNIQKDYKQIFEVGNWESSIRNNQYYIHKFYVNETLHAVSLCCSLPEGDILIKYWAPLQICDDETSQFLFKKYLEHIEKNTLAKSIFYNASQIKEVLSNGFIKQKERIYVRERKLVSEIDGFGYYPFLTINFSNIAVPKSTSKDVLDELIVPANDTPPFSEKQFVYFNYLLVLNKLVTPGFFSAVCTYTPNLRNIQDVQTKMIKEELTDLPYNALSTVSPLHLLTFRMRNPLFSAFFVAGRPTLKLTGEEIFSDEDSLIVSLQLLKNNTKLYFGKGFSTLNGMIASLKQRSKPKKIQYCVRMFRKRMRGRILSINLKDEFCFGDFEVVFEWRDFLKGRVEHDLEEYELFGPEGFYCVLEVDRQNIFGFQITPNNLI